MKPYTITFFNTFTSKKIKNIKGNFFPDNINKDTPRYMQIILEDESSIIIDITKYKGYKVSKELFYNEVEKAKAEGQGQVQL